MYNSTKACWQHAMETFSILLALCGGNPPIILTKYQLIESFDIFLLFTWRAIDQLNFQWFDMQWHLL